MGVTSGLSLKLAVPVTLSIIVIRQSVVMRIKHSNVCQVFSAVAGTS